MRLLNITILTPTLRRSRWIRWLPPIDMASPSPVTQKTVDHSQMSSLPMNLSGSFVERLKVKSSKRARRKQDLAAGCQLDVNDVVWVSATKGEGIDICSPTNVRSGQWVELELLQAWDYSRIPNISNANPSMVRVGNTEWNFGNKGSHWLPHIWGTEAIGWRTDLWSPRGGTPSYGDIWSEENKGKTMLRPHSGMLGAGLYMETIGKLEPGSMWKAYSSEDTMRKTWQQVTDWCIAHKSHIKLFWNDADSQKNGFMNDGVIVGQTWDGPPLALKSAGEPVTYQAPKEGALAWVDGMSLSKASKNVDQAYEFVKFCFMQEPAGKAIDKHGYNSAVLGSAAYASAQYKKNFQEAYPGDALSNLNPWPAEPQWYADVRTEYRNKFVNA